MAFPEAQKHFKTATRVTGTPVRAEFHAVNATDSRAALGLRPADPVLLVMGGSQGAAGINRLLLEALPVLVERFPLLQFLHLTGAADLSLVQSAYHRLGVKALVQVFCPEMQHALGAATLAISRAGGSSLAELAATRTPSVLVPFPAAADQHQQFNAAALARGGGAVVVAQDSVGGPEFTRLLVELLSDASKRTTMRERLTNGQPLDAATQIVAAMFARLPGRPAVAPGASPRPDAAPSTHRFHSVTS